MPKVKITAPEQKRKVRITPPKSIPQAKWGMAMPNQYNVLDTRWSPVAFQGQISVNPRPDPFEKTKRTLPEVSPEEANVNAEKHEMVLGNFTPDGLPSLMDVNGPPHTKGGKNIHVPEAKNGGGSFIFSDTPKLKIKDKKALKHFGEHKAKTPAAIAKKYDLQKFTKVLANPNSDDVSKKTAELMVQNYTQKLQQLASVQEQKKASLGLDNDLQQQQSQQPPMAQYGYNGTPGGNPFDTKYDSLVNKTKDYLHKMYPDKDIDVYKASGDRELSTQAAIQKSGASHTPVSLHNIGAARDYHIYLDGKLVDNKQANVYKNSLWKAADDMHMNHLNGNAPSAEDPHPFGNTDPYHVSVVKETNAHDAYGRALQQYPQIMQTPLFQRTEKALSHASDPISQGYYSQIQQAKNSSPVNRRYGGIPHMQGGGGDPEGNTDAGYKYVPHHIVPYTAGKINGANWTGEQFDKVYRSYGYTPESGLTPGEYITKNYPEVAKAQIDKYGPANDATPTDMLGTRIGIRHQLPIPARPQIEWGDTVENPYQLPELPIVQTATTVPDPTNISNTTNPDQTLGSYNKTETKTPDSGTKVPFTAPTPDKWGMQNSLLNAATIHRYPAWEAPIGAVAPNTIFEDPTRAIAAQQELANSAGYNNAISGDGRTARANNLYGQGIAGAEAANILGAVGNRNVQISNQASREVADISNKLMQAQANRLNRMYQGNVISSQQYDNAMREARNAITKDAQTAWKDRQIYDTANQTNPLYSYDPVSGKIIPKNEAQQAAVESRLKAMEKGEGYKSGGIGAQVNAIYEQLVKQPAYQTDEGKKRALFLAEEEAGARQKKKTTSQGYNSIPKTTTTTGIYAGPEEKYGGSTRKNYKIGGFTQRQLKKFIKLPS